jgi:hypothetical protein
MVFLAYDGQHGIVQSAAVISKFSLIRRAKYKNIQQKLRLDELEKRRSL